MPADQINPVAVEAMAEEGIDIAAEQPKILTTQAVQDSDVVITMGCGDTCPFYPGKRYEDWTLDDPAGQGIDAVRPIRDEIKRPHPKRWSTNSSRPPTRSGRAVAGCRCCSCARRMAGSRRWPPLSCGRSRTTP
jgi:hypothetical protein